MALGTRTVRRRRTVKIGENRYRVGKQATRTATKENGVKTVTLQKKTGGAITKVISKSADAKNLRIGAKARSDPRNTSVVNPDGSVTKTFYKAGGGTVTKTISAAADAKKKKKRGSNSSSNSSNNSNNSSNTNQSEQEP